MTSALVRFGAASSALVIPLCLLAPYPVRCFVSLPLSSSPLVRDFPHPSQRSGCLGFPGPRRAHRIKCVINRPQASGSLFSEARRSLFPSRRGFLLHAVTRLHWPRVISTTRGSATLCPLTVQGPPLPARFYGARGNFVLQDRSASRGKTHHLLVSRPASACFGFRSDIGTRSNTPARPPPHTHIAGSLFATYTSSASCFLQTSHLWKCPCLVGCRPSVRPRWTVSFRLVCHARRTSIPPVELVA